MLKVFNQLVFFFFAFFFFACSSIPNKTLARPAINERFFRMVKENDLIEVKALLKAGADTNVRDEYGETALTWASAKGHVQMVGVLLAAGANVNIHNGRCLRLAASNGHSSTVKHLLSAGAFANSIDEVGWTALMWAA